MLYQSELFGDIIVRRNDCNTFAGIVGHASEQVVRKRGLIIT